MVRRGKALSHELRIRRCLVPTDSSDWIFFAPLWIVAHFPRRWAGPSRGIVEKSDCFIPRNSATVLYKWLLPELALVVTSRLDESLVLLIRDLVPVDGKVVDLGCGAYERGYPRPTHPPATTTISGGTLFRRTKLQREIEAQVFAGERHFRGCL
jgi:hypothetical protein